MELNKNYPEISTLGLEVVASVLQQCSSIIPINHLFLYIIAAKERDTFHSDL